MLLKTIHSITCLLFTGLLVVATGCVKEYSYEGQTIVPPAPDTTILPPPAPPPDTAPEFALCADCVGRDDYEENRWSFKAGNSFLCGIIDTAIVNIERNAFTFFGPSACSLDTNMVISVYLESQKLDRSQQNMVIPKVFFYYSAAGSPQFVLVSRSGTPFTVILNTYDHQTKMTTGSFSGYVFKADGTTTLIHSTKFKLKLI